MRTRIALVAIVAIALITVSILVQTATEQPARASSTSSSGTMSSSSVVPAIQLVASQRLTSVGPPVGQSSIVLDVTAQLLAGPPPAPVVTPAPAPQPVDTVTPDQRAAWERVAMCEEGGNWAYAGGRFSGGLGITRANWAAYGGEQYASSGSLASEDQQIMVAERIQPTAPDQYGCRGW